MPKTDTSVESQVQEVIALQTKAQEIELAIQSNHTIRELTRQKSELDGKIADFWKAIEEAMIATGTKSIKGDWGYVTLVEKIGSWTVTDKLPAKFMKKVLDSTKISNHFKLTGKAPEGATPNFTRYLRKEIK